MLVKKYSPIQMAASLGMVAIMTVSCNSGDYKTDKEETVTTTVDSGNTAVANTVDEPLAKLNDTVDTSLIRKDSVASSKIGYAKPNPAKKGKKGKAGIAATGSAMQRNDNSAMEMDREGFYNRVEVLPSYPGGQKALEKFIESTVTYPEDAINEGVEGTVNVVFAVDENGKVYTPSIKNERAGYGLDEEAMRLVSKMPKWNPGQIKGKNVKTRFTLPITFMIN